MAIRAEFYVTCDSCGVFLGEDRGESDDLFSTFEEAAQFASECGYVSADGWDTSYCPECAKHGPMEVQ